MFSALQRALQAQAAGDANFLTRATVSLQKELESPTWLYEDFRAAFLQQYKKYPRMTAHLDRPLPDH